MPNVVINPQAVSKLSTKDQISELNHEVRCTLRPSSIQGIGVFALRDIDKGERLYLLPHSPRKWYNVSYANFGKLFPYVREVILARWPSVVNGSAFLAPNDDAWLLSFVNHSDESNYHILTDIALRDIKSGEEITEDYTTMDNWGQIWPWLVKE